MNKAQIECEQIISKRHTHSNKKEVWITAYKSLLEYECKTITAAMDGADDAVKRFQKAIE